MKLASLIQHDDANCNGCPACNLEMASLLEPDLRRAFRSAGAQGHTFRVSQRDDDAIPPPPDLNARILTGRRDTRTQVERAREAKLRANMRPPASPEDPTPAVRAASQRRFDAEHDVPSAISNEQFNARIRSARGVA